MVSKKNFVSKNTVRLLNARMGYQKELQKFYVLRALNL